jgi:hypothetical protein
LVGSGACFYPGGSGRDPLVCGGPPQELLSCVLIIWIHVIKVNGLTKDFSYPYNQRMTDEPKRGGKRPGAGRPAGSSTTGSSNPANKFQFRLPEEVARWVDQKGGNDWLKQLAMDAFLKR